VNGETISAEAYRNLYRRQLDYYRDSMGERFSDDFLEKLNLRQSVIDMLINRVLMLKEAGSLGIKVTKWEIQDAILTMPGFQRDGVFDEQVYFSVLRQNRLQPGEFESSVENDLSVQKVRGRVIADVAVTDREVLDAFARDYKRISLEFIKVGKVLFTALVEVSDEEAREYLAANSGSFMEPLRVKAFYARLGFDEVSSGEAPTDEDVKGYYDEFLIDFQKVEEVSARHILIRTGQEGDGDGAKEAARKKAQELLDRVRGGEDFSKLAREFSGDPGSAEKGGELGFFPRGVMVRPFEEAAFSLDVGSVSDLVETEYGFHIIKVEDKKLPGSRPLEEVAEEIKERLIAKQARQTAGEKMIELRKTFKQTASVEEIQKEAGRLGIKTFSTALVSEADPVVELTGVPALRNTTFLLGEGEVSSVMEASGALYVIKILERVEEHVSPFEEVSDSVFEAVKNEKAIEEAKAKADELLKRLSGGDDMAVLLAAEKLTKGETGFFSKRDGLIPVINVFAGNNPAIFDLTEGSPYYNEVLPAGEDFFILKLKDTREADEGLFESEKAAIKARLLNQVRQEAVEEWIEGLRAKAEITINEDML
jgi:peptidyl-prolyl cis-trans isomerase D